MKKNKKSYGFTLIEILSAVIILGIIGIIAVVSVSNYISDSRRSSFTNIARMYVEEARAVKSRDELDQEAKKYEAILVPFAILNLDDNDDYETPYGTLVLNKSYIIITNSDEPKYYVAMTDETGVSIPLVDVNKLTNDDVSSDSKASGIKSIEEIRNGGITIDIDGVIYELSSRNVNNAKTIVLDSSILSGFRVEYDNNWFNQDKTIKIVVSGNSTGYEYYLSNRLQKPSKTDSLWQSNNEYVRGMGTYYAFVKSPDGEISEGEKVIIDKIDTTKPSCKLKATGTKSPDGVFITDAVVSFEVATDGDPSDTTSGVKRYGIGSLESANTKTHKIDGPELVTYTGYIEDRAGNSNKCEITVKSDGTAPDVDYSLASGTYFDIKSLVITPSDNQGIDYYNVYVYKDGTLLNKYENLKTTSHTVSLNKDGVYEVRTMVVDIAGNKITKTPQKDGMYYQTYTMNLTYSITYNLNGGTATNPTTYNINTETFTLNNPTKTGYTFTGWTGSNGTTASKSVSIAKGSTGNKTYTANWTVTNYTVTYNLNGGTATNPTSYNINSAAFTLNNPTRTGYTFTGWTGSNGTTASKSVSIAKGSTGNKTYTANWTPVSYTITYNLNGGSASNKTSYTIETATFTLTNPTRAGYTFTGWTGSNGTTASKSVSIAKGTTGNKTYTANWKSSTYTVAYNCNGGSGSTASSTHTYGVTKALTTNGCIRNAIAGTGTGTSASPNVYVFTGWSTSSTATSPTYTNGQSVTNLAQSGTVTLYAVWKKMFTYSGSYQVINDGSNNWRVKFYGSGTFTPLVTKNIDIFAVGGGGGGFGVASEYGCGGGGGGGYTKTVKTKISSGTNYTVTIGAGGNNASSGSVSGRGGTSSFGSLVSAAGGYGGTFGSDTALRDGGNGGSGGTAFGSSAVATDGNDGPSSSYYGSTGGTGQHTTTKEFGETSGQLFASGGNGACPWLDSNPGASTPNTGNGGHTGYAGASGIVVIRNSADCPIDYTYTGNSECIDEGSGKWKIKFYSSGTFKTTSSLNIDIFVAGGGGGGGYGSTADGTCGGGGGGGYTSTLKARTISANTNYIVTVGLGGTMSSSASAISATGGTSSFGSLVSAAGGKGGTHTWDMTGRIGGNGGSGGSGAGSSVIAINGANGGTYAEYNVKGGTGQGTTTREFGDSSETLYSSGGNGTCPWMEGNTGRSAANTGNGGNTGYDGSSGIVVIRNKR